MSFPFRLLSFMLLTIAWNARAEVKVSAIFSDHMVLQRDVAVPLWGTALPGEEVTVRFASQQKTVRADANGKWLLHLDPLKVVTEGLDLRIGSILIRDVLVGEVWLASGQSNMAFGLNAAHNAAEAIPQAGDPQLRFFTVTKKTAAEPQAELEGKWAATTPQNAKSFSAVAYFFAREIRRTQHCPVALIHSSWGGTPVQTWISLDALKREPPLTKSIRQWDQAVEQNRKVQSDPKVAADYLSELERWKKESAGGVKPAWPEPSNPDPMGMPSPSRRPQIPAISFNAMIAPVIPYSLRGVIWYQGEQDGTAGIDYRELFPRLIEDWRRRWGADFPFLYVQLPANGKDSTPVAEKGWPWLREAQLLTLSYPHTAMAIAIDVGDPNNVHPTDKLDVGNRLALLARRDVYGEKLVASGPLFAGFQVEGPKIRVNFHEVGSGLKPGVAPWRADGVEPLPTDRLIGFYIAGEDRHWSPAEAFIEGASVIVSSPAVPRPVAVRYGWANSPRCNLYNKEDLPASPFRTDDWPK